MIYLNELSMSYGEKVLFYDVNLILNNNTRYALVGANGCGKSTFLKLITHEEEPLMGHAAMPKEAVVGWLKQDQYRYEESLITEVVIQGKPLLWEALVEKEQLLSSEEWNDEMGYRLGKLEEIIAHHGGYTANALAEKLLTGLGIAVKYHYEPLKSLSGGYKLRVLLAQALFQQPDILLLDEPTNHLDVISIVWLEKYLRSEFSGLLVFISHDVSFINRLANHILDVDYGEINQYSGNYEKFLLEKKLVEDNKIQMKAKIEKRVSEMQRFVERFGALASKAKQAQSRVKMIEKVVLPDIKQSSRIEPHFQFKPEVPSGKNVLSVKNLSKFYNETEIFKNVSFNVQRKEKVAIIGENGIGKSTLIKVLLGKVLHEEGHYEWGHETRISYFSQDHHETLDKRLSVLEWISGRVSQRTEQQIRKTLGQVLLKKEEVKKNILALSGGEAARLLLAEIMLEAGNVLILDEPTNHLDIEATNALANALVEYMGTLIFVSHDRYFIEKVATRILFISKNKEIVDFSGKYNEFEKSRQ